MIFFGIYDNLTSEHVPGLLKYDVCMTEQVSGPQGTKIAGRHMAMIPYDIQFIKANVCTKHSNSIIPTILASHDFYSYLCELYECGRA